MNFAVRAIGARDVYQSSALVTTSDGSCNVCVSADQQWRPRLDELTACGARLVKAMGWPEPDAAAAAAFFDEILFAPGGRRLWVCLQKGWITETEFVSATIDRFVDRFASWLPDSNGANAPPEETWANPEFVGAFEIALLGRPALRDN